MAYDASIETVADCSRQPPRLRVASGQARRVTESGRSQSIGCFGAGRVAALGLFCWKTPRVLLAQRFARSLVPGYGRGQPVGSISTTDDGRTRPGKV